MLSFAKKDMETLINCLAWLGDALNQDLFSPVKTECNYTPTQLEELNKQIGNASRFLHENRQRDQTGDVPEDFRPLYKQALIFSRRQIANGIERRGQHVQHGELKANLQKELDDYDWLIGQEWFHQTPPMKLPKLTEYLSLQKAEELLIRQRRGSELSQREYDEKFHILQAPSLFQKDLDYFRKQCDLRGSSVTAAFIDIDDFKKKFNSPYSNERVDRDVLPRFMGTLEAHVFARGFAYRQGGDEYLALLPNVSLEEAIRVLDQLRLKLANTQYAAIPDRTTVSIGICHVGDGCYLTDAEVRERATRASAFAKEPEKSKPKKNCIATYKGGQYRQEDLYIAAPCSNAEA
jgi:diguanylate cyclase (GGDEF)-like protein